jgi:hypothetical protein
VEAGQPYDLFWGLTFREIAVILQGVTDRRAAESNERMALAWHIEALSRGKKLPRLDTLLAKAKPKKKGKMSPSHMEAVTRAWLGSRNIPRSSASANPMAE